MLVGFLRRFTLAHSWTSAHLSHGVVRACRVALSLSLSMIIGIVFLLGARAQTEIPATASGSDQQQMSLQEARRLNKEVLLLYSQGRYAEAMPLAQKVLVFNEKELGSEHTDTASSLNNLALLYKSQGRYADAEPLLKRALAICEKAFGSDHPKTATILNNLSAMYLNQGRYQEAEPLLKRALAIREMGLGLENQDTANTLNTLAVLYDDQGRYLEAEPLYKRALAIQEKVLGPDHPDTALSFNNLGELYRKQGRYSEAEPLFKRALAIQEKALGPDHPANAASLNNLALLYRNQGRYPEAEPLYKRALAIYEKAFGSEHPENTTFLDNLAELYRKQGRHPEAVPLHKRALAIREKALGPDHPDTATSLNNLAALYLNQGSYQEAEPLLKRALAIQEKALGPDHPVNAASLNNLALLYRNQGRYQEAEPLLKRALAIQEKTIGPEHPDTAQSLNNLALLYEKQVRYPEAEPLFKRALAIREKVLGPEHPDTATSLNNLAALYLHQGRYPEAEPPLKRALAINEKVLGSEHPDTATSLSTLAVLYTKQVRYSEAEPLFKRALAIYEKALGPKHPDTATSLNNLAILHLALGNTEQALQELMRARDIEERILQAQLAAGSEDQKLAFADTYSTSLPIDISLHLNTAPQNLQAAQLALTTLLQRKGRVLDILASELQTLRQKLPPQQRDLLDRWQAAVSNYAFLALHSPDKNDPKKYRQSLDALLLQKQDLEEQLAKLSVEFRQRTQTVTIEDVQLSLPKGAVLVELSRYQPFDFKSTGTTQQWGKPRYAAYVLGADGSLHWKDLGEADVIETAVTRLRAALSDVYPNSNQPKNSKEQVENQALEVDRLLLEPIRPWLADSPLVLISPDGELNRLPFEVLVDPQGRYFLQQHTVQYLGSGRDLLHLASPTQVASTPAILIGAPDYNANLGSNVPIASDINKGLLLTPIAATASQRSGSFDEFFAPLPGTKEEVERIHTLISFSDKPFLNQQATESALKALYSPWILHIATHGFFLPDLAQNLSAPFLLATLSEEANRRPPQKLQENPLLRSGLALTGANTRDARKSGDDGILTALEVSALDLSGTELVTLSACETGDGSVRTGEGVLGLRRALTAAGARSQLVSLWKVDSEATSALMVEFYTALQSGMGRAEALRQLKLSKLEGSSEKYRHPYYWAAFIGVGDWRALPQSPRTSLNPLP
jgi:CHAT domain-containing protein/tetratricopeptide (TPR) repeat protein